ncbi:MAG TPA: CBS domain-containing protein [Gallionella sp.]|nr:CBS domain-containing protein [Gallionella sp.]
MKTLQQLLGATPRTPIAVAPNDSVMTALEIMAKHDVGALLVMDGDKLAGIFSERDYARKIILQGKSSKETKVSEIMTSKVIFAKPSQTVDQAMALMTDKRIRHLPVMEGEKLLGMVSIGDLVKETISEQAFVISQLENYIRM